MKDFAISTNPSTPGSHSQGFVNKQVYKVPTEKKGIMVVPPTLQWDTASGLKVSIEAVRAAGGFLYSLLRGRAAIARQAHNLEVGGLNPPPASNLRAALNSTLKRVTRHRAALGILDALCFLLIAVVCLGMLFL